MVCRPKGFQPFSMMSLIYEEFDSKNEIFYTMSTQLVKHGSTAMFITSGQYAQVVDSLVRRVGNGQGQLEVRF